MMATEPATGAKPEGRIASVLFQTRASATAEAERKAYLIERRRHTRHPSNLRGSCRPIVADRGIHWEVRVRDVSAGGIALLMYRPLRPGTVLTVYLRRPNVDSTHLLLVRVIHTRRHVRGQWLVGCMLPRPVSDDELEALRA
jgi:hypothetical protein